ncbi:MAG: pitrilysin family protein [Deltaproteobacteria bacterium]|nr:pitrilysin family protein [Deltaproteobacteria bacterium]
MRRLIVLLAGCAAVFSHWPAVAAAPVARSVAQTKSKGVSLQTWALKNGLKVVFAARQGAPLVSVQIVYHVGSRDEKAGTRGLARIMRELMFRGSARVPPGGHSRLIARVGGRVAAHGDEDITAFANTVPAPYTEMAIELEAERMRGLSLKEADVAAVRQFVLRSRQRQVDGSALGKSIELLRGDVFGGHPYANGVMGVVADLRRISVDDCARFHQTHFGPNNATLVVAGAISEAALRPLVEKHFGAIAPNPALAARQGFTPAPAAPAKALKLPVEKPMVAIGVPLPRLSPRERASVYVLSEVLAGGSAGRLSRRLVGPKSAALAAGGAPLALEDGGVLVLFAVHQPDHTSDEIRRIMLDELAQMRDKPIDLEELTQARLRAAATVAGALSSTEGLANALAMATAVEGELEQAMLRPQQILDVSQSDIGRLANQYLREDMLSILMLTPEGRPAAEASQPKGTP